MPWTGKDAKRHSKAANTPAKQKQWSSVANRVLAESGDEGKAVRIANAAVTKHPSTKKTQAKRGRK